jgi:fucose permease
VFPLLIRRPGAVAALGYLGLLAVGWSGLLVPSAIRQIEADFRQTDAAVGVFYLLSAISYGSGSLAGGLLTERFGRRTILVLAVVVMAVGFVTLATAPTWLVFVAAGVPTGLAGGAIDAGTNGLILDLFPAALGRALNRLHLFFSLGALSAPLAVGQLLGAGVTWQTVALATGIAVLPLAVLLVVADVPHGRHTPTSDGPRRLALAGPLLLLAIGIGCYVGSEIGVSNWLVRFLEAAPLGLATGTLSLFWAGLTAGRLVLARFGDRFDHLRSAIVASVVSAVALVIAVGVPSLPLSIALFGLAGFAFGPIYPLIMAIGGERFPGRSAAVSGILGASAVAGSVIYPPAMGVVSETVGLGAAMLGAAGLAIACAVALVVSRSAPVIVRR